MHIYIYIDRYNTCQRANVQHNKCIHIPPSLSLSLSRVVFPLRFVRLWELLDSNVGPYSMFSQAVALHISCQMKKVDWSLDQNHWIGFWVFLQFLDGGFSNQFYPHFVWFQSKLMNHFLWLFLIFFLILANISI